MKLFRIGFIRDTMIFIAGIAFLNMGFFLAEVSALDLGKYTRLLENIAASGFEEERDCGGEQTPGSGDADEKVDLMSHHYLIQHSVPVPLALQRKGSRNELFCYYHHLEIFCPPPEG
jgi:hypothetical protein